VRRVAVAIVLGRALSAYIVASLLPGIANADESPPSAFVQGVVGHPQEHNLSCESRSATDLAAYWGTVFSEDDFFRRLPRSDNPYRGFLGDVDLPPGTMPPAGYGVYGGPELAAGRPVIVWATYDMRLPGVEAWTSSDGATSVVVQWQHTFIAVGYDEGGLYLVDAYDGAEKYFTYEAFDSAWAQLGRMAVTVEGPVEGPATQSGGRMWAATDIDGRRSFVVDGRWWIGPE
jgi:hypothetical protein